MFDKKLFETVANNIAEDIINFEGSQEELDYYLAENFYYTWLEGTSEWVVAWDCEVLFDGLKHMEAHDLYFKLDNRAHAIVDAKIKNH